MFCTKTTNHKIMTITENKAFIRQRIKNILDGYLDTTAADTFFILNDVLTDLFEAFNVPLTVTLRGDESSKTEFIFDRSIVSKSALPATFIKAYNLLVAVLLNEIQKELSK